MRRAAICVLILAGCASPPTTREGSRESHAVVTDREREETRQSVFLAMVKPESCYQKSLDYAVRDADFLNRVLARLLAGKSLDDLIVSDRTYTSSGITHEIARLMREAPAAYAAELRTPDGLARIEKTIAQRFEHPRIEVRLGVVVVDFGHVEAKLKAAADSTIGIDFAASPHLNAEHEWQTAEIARILESQVQKHPGVAGVRLRVLIPGGPKPSEWFYEYLIAADRIRVFWGDNSIPPLETPVLGHDFAPYRDGTKSLSTSQLKRSR